jgi:hypothetical protein
VAEGPHFSVVIWDDAHSKGADYVSQATLHEAHMPTVMQTLGWVLRDDQVGVSIANERCMDDGEDYYRGYTFIPRSLIKSVTPFTLSRPRRKKAPDVQSDPPAGS